MSVHDRVIGRIGSIFGSSAWNDYLEDACAHFTDVYELCDHFEQHPEICTICEEICDESQNLGAKLRNSFLAEDSVHGAAIPPV